LRAKPSAIWLRQQLPTHTNKTLVRLARPTAEWLVGLMFVCFLEFKVLI
jgi:hypothetical protein